MNRLIDRIAALLTSSVKTPRSIVQIYKGDPIYIPKVNLPAITVNPETTAIRTIDNIHDEKISAVSIILILDVRDYTQNNSGTQESGLYDMIKVMEEEDSSGVLKADTIMGTMRKQLYDDPTYALKISDERISYGFSDMRGFPTVEVAFTFTVHGYLYQRD